MPERPVSAASSGTSGPTHTRHASVSKNATKSTGLTVVSLFLTNLRLLNIDLLPDWPNITVSSFGNHDARTKIKCTEYALYHLFRLYDPATTADKLQPFFPPLEPLQSVNLRSALFRCLNELKKNGVLSKDTVLRKTMLDECQGDRFWEVCLGFSAVVVRKSTLERRAKYGKPLAERYGTTQSLSKAQKESMLPLAIAHKAALSNILDEKRRKRDTYVRLHGLVVDKDHEMRQRKVKAQEQAAKTSSIQPAKLNATEKAIHKSWVGSTELKDALIEGDTCAKGDGMLLQSFDYLWHGKSVNSRRESNGAEVGLLQSLNSKAAEQTARLRKWQSYYDQLLASKPASAKSSRPTSGTQKPALRFDRHQDLTLRDSSPDSERSTEETTRRSKSVMRYDEILTTMREELRKNSSLRGQSTASKPPIKHLKRAQTQPVPARKPSIAVDTSPGATNPHARSPSQTTIPLGARLGRRVSSQSRSYEKPKVESQRQPIPLKAELFSPLKDKRRSSVSPSFAISTLPSPAEEQESTREPVATEHVKSNGNEAVENGEAHHATKHDSKFDPATPGAGSEDTPTTDQSFTPVVLECEHTPTVGSEFKAPEVPVNRPRTTGSTVRPSLAERTRMSIAFNSSDNVTTLLPEQSVDGSADAQSPEETLIPSDSQPTVDRRVSLLDRTRQSITMAPPTQPGVKAKKSTHSRSRTSIYPINQFETPKKTRRSTIGVKDESKRDITPLDQLYSPDAEYASVFKSRPKIALSPVLSPYDDANASGNVTLDEDVGRSSPLIDVGGRR